MGYIRTKYNISVLEVKENITSTTTAPIHASKDKPVDWRLIHFPALKSRHIMTFTKSALQSAILPLLDLLEDKYNYIFTKSALQSAIPD
jgi:hypothetical protein